MNVMTLEELLASLQAHEQRLNEKSQVGVEEALQSQLILKTDKAESSRQAESSQKNQHFNNRGRRNFISGPGRGQGNDTGQKRDKSQIQCHNCKKYGHYKFECWSGRQNNMQYHAKIAENNNENSETLLLACNGAEEDCKNQWFLDKGCSNHMCGQKDLFSDLNESFRSMVKFGNSTTVPVLGKGKISIILKDGSRNFISDVFYVLGLHQNLLSMGQLSERGYDMRIFKGVCTITDGRKGLIAKVNMTPNRLFPLKINCENLPYFSSMVLDNMWLWHMRLGYMNFGSLSFVTRKKKSFGIALC